MFVISPSSCIDTDSYNLSNKSLNAAPFHPPIDDRGDSDSFKYPIAPVYDAQHFYDEGIFFWSKGDLVQCSEKFWSAITFEQKKTMFAVGVDTRSHDALTRSVNFLGNYIDEGDRTEFENGWYAAEELHRNHYRNHLDPEDIYEKIPRVAGFINALEKINLEKVKDGLPEFMKNQIAKKRVVVVDEKVDHGGILYKVSYRMRF